MRSAQCLRSNQSMGNTLKDNVLLFSLCLANEPDFYIFNAVSSRIYDERSQSFEISVRNTYI